MLVKVWLKFCIDCDDVYTVNREIFMYETNHKLSFFFYLSTGIAQLRPLVTKVATVELVDDTRVTCNLQL